jgi:hypothetical protein
LLIDFGYRVIIGAVEYPIFIDIIIHHSFIDIAAFWFLEKQLNLKIHPQENILFRSFCLVILNEFAPNNHFDFPSNLLLSVLSDYFHMDILRLFATFPQERNWFIE